MDNHDQGEEIHKNTIHMGGGNLILDLNLNRQGSQPKQNRSLKNGEGQHNIDPIEWSKSVELPKNDYFSYPSDMNLAELHRQCQYIQPDKNFLSRSSAEQCSCCNKKLNRERINMWTYDVYKQFIKDYGITLPLHFTFLKLHTTIMTAQFIIFGIFYIYHSNRICQENPGLICYDDHYGDRDACQFVGLFGFIDLNNFTQQIRMNPTHSTIYQLLAFLVFIINICVPLIHEVVIFYTRIKYLDLKSTNHVKDYNCSVYIKHLPNKMSLQELQTVAWRAIQDNIKTVDYLRDIDEENSIQELIYIYDTSQVNQMNERRIKSLQNILLIAQQIKELKEQGVITSKTPEQQSNKKQIFSVNLLQVQFTFNYYQLISETATIQAHLNEGLPFSNKVILKFRSKEQRDAVYTYYKKSKWIELQIRFRVLKRTLQEMKQRKVANDYEMGSESRCSRDEPFLLESLQVINEDHSNDTNSDRQSSNSFQMQADTDYFREDHKEIRIYRGFKVNEINWQNIGMNTLTRFVLRIWSLVITVIACAIFMSLYEFMYLYQNDPQFKSRQDRGQLTTLEKVAVQFFAVSITLVSVCSTLILLAQTVKSKRSTFTQEERNIAKFILFIQLILISAFPVLMTFQHWKGLLSVMPIYDLISIWKSRIIMKLIFCIFHVRKVKFWSLRRKLIKNFSPHQYFQGQLNAIMTPPKFPHRGRFITMLFIYTSGVTTIFICPMMMILCVPCDIILYFYDKRQALESFKVDTLFKIKHIQYLVKVYQFVVAPLNIYLFLTIFWWSEFCIYAGSIVSIFVFFIYLFLREPMVKFIVMNLIRPTRACSPKVEGKTYFRSYNDYFEGLKIERLTDLISGLFKQVQTPGQSEGVTS